MLILTKELKEMNQLQQKVFMLLPKGITRLISTQEIEDVLDIDKRYIMGIIETLILEYGIPIGSFRTNDNFGYFIATNEKEKEIGTHSLSQQAESMLKRAEKVKNSDLKITTLYRKQYIDGAEHYDIERQLSIYEYLNADELNTPVKDNNQLQNF